MIMMMTTMMAMYVITGQTATDKTAHWTVAYRPPVRRCIDPQCRGPATPLIAASSTTFVDPTSSSRRRAACRQPPQYLMLVSGTSQTPRPRYIRGSVGAASRSVDSRRRCVSLTNVEYKSGQRGTSLAQAGRVLLITTRSVLGDITRCLTVAYLQQSTQVLVPIIQSRPIRTGTTFCFSLLTQLTIFYGSAVFRLRCNVTCITTVGSTINHHRKEKEKNVTWWLSKLTVRKVSTVKRQIVTTCMTSSKATLFTLHCVRHMRLDFQSRPLLGHCIGVRANFS